MERYEYLETISSGAYGVCYKVLDTTTGQHCAAKGIKQAHEDAEVMRLTLREVKVLKTLPPHVNVVRLLEAFRSHSGRVYLVFEYVERSLYQELERHPSGALPGPMVKSVAWQLLHALGHCHEHGFMHRDVKPANVLLTGYTPGVGSGGVVKLCDFGFARAIPSCSTDRMGGGDGGLGAGAAGLSSYVMTRWYRPPEVLVGDMYGTSIDVWSYGCTLAELATGRPLFPGCSTVDQLWRIMRCLGPLSMQQTACMRRDTRLQPVWTPPQRLKTLRQRLPDLDPRLYEVVSACLTLDPQRRPTVQHLLQMPYFWDVRSMIANTDLARQLPYAADVACRISFRQPTATTAAASAVKKAAIASGASNRTDAPLVASSPPNKETAAAAVDNFSTAPLATPSAEDPNLPAVSPAVAVGLRPDDNNATAIAAAAPVASVIEGQGAVVQFVDAKGLASIPPPIISTQATQSKQQRHGGLGIAAATHDISNCALRSSGGADMVTFGTACTDSAKGTPAGAATAAQDLTATAAAAAAGGVAATATATATAKAEQGWDTTAAASRSGSGGGGGVRGTPRVPSSKALMVQMAEAANTANAAAAAAARVAVAAAASAAASATAAMSIGTCDATHEKRLSIPQPLLPPAIRTSSPVHSTTPRTPARENDPLATTAGQRNGGEISTIAGSYRAPAMAAHCGDREGVAAPAPSNSLRVLDAACLYQALSGNDESEFAVTYESAAAPSAGPNARAPVATGTVANPPNPFAAARFKTAAGGAAAAVATTATMGSSVAAGPLASQPSSFQYEVNSGAAVPYLANAAAFTAYKSAALTQMDSGGLLYLPLGTGEEGSPSVGMPMVAAAAVEAVMAAAPAPARQPLQPPALLQPPAQRPNFSVRQLRHAATTRAGGSGSTGGAVIISGPDGSGFGGRGGGDLRRMYLAERAVSTGGHGPIRIAAGIGTGAGARIVDTKYDAASRAAHDTHETITLTSELKYIGSPAGAPGLCQFINAGAQLPHQRGPPPATSFLFLSSPSDTNGSFHGADSTTGGACAGTTAEVALSSGQIPGCTFEFDPYQSTVEQPTDAYDANHASLLTTCSPVHPTTRHPSRLWGWVLSSLRLVGGLDAPPVPPSQQQAQQQLVQQQYQMQQRPQQQAVAGTFVRTMRWLGSHGGGAAAGSGGGTSRHEVLDTGSPFYAAAAAAAAYGGGSVGGSCTMGSVLGGGGVGTETGGPSTPDGYGNSQVKSGVLDERRPAAAAAGVSYRGGSPCHLHAGSVHGAYAESGGSLGPKGPHYEKPLISSRSLPGWLFGHLHRGSSNRTDTVDVSPGTGSMGGVVKFPKANSQQVVVQASHSYLHAPGETITSTMSSACLPPVEEPRPEPWVSNDAASAAFRRPPSGVVGAGSEVATSFGSSGAAAVATARSSAPTGVGVGSRATSGTLLTYMTEAEAAAITSDDNRSVRRQRRGTLQQGSQPLYGRPRDIKSSVGIASLSTVGALAPQLQQQQQVLLPSGRQVATEAVAAPAPAPSTARRTGSKIIQRSTSTPASRSGSSRLGSSSLSNSSTPAAATAARRGEKRNGGCLPVAFASAALVNAFSSFRSTRPKSSHARGCPGAGDSSAGGGGSGSLNTGSTQGGSVHDPSGSTGGSVGNTGGTGGGGNMAGADMLPYRLSIGKCGLSPLSDEKRASMGSSTTAPSVCNVMSTLAPAAASTATAGVGGIAADEVAGGQQQSAAPGSVVEYKFNVVSADGCSGVGYSFTEEDSNNKLMRQSAACPYGARLSLNMPCYMKPSGTSSGPLGITRSSGDGSPSLQSAAVGGRGSGGGGGGGGSGGGCETFLPPQIVGPTIPESEEGTVGLSGGGSSYCIAKTPLLPPPPPPSCQQAMGAAPVATGARCGGTVVATAGGPRESTAMSPVARYNAVAVTADATTAGSVATNWRLPGALASIFLSARSPNTWKVKTMAVAKAPGPRRVAGSDGEGPSAVSPVVGGTGRRMMCAAILTDDGGKSIGGRTMELADEPASSGARSTTKSSGGIRSRLRNFKLHVRDLLVGTK